MRSPIQNKDQAPPLALSEEEDNLRSLVEGAPIGIYRSTPDGRVFLANRALLQILGYSSFEEFTSLNVESGLYTPDYPRHKFLNVIEQKGSVEGLEFALRRKDGGVIFVREYARAVRGPDGKTRYYEGTLEDVTAHRRAEEALRENEARWRSLIENAPEVILNINRNGEILFINRVLEGVEQGKVIGTTIYEYFPPADVERIRPVIEQAWDTGRPASYEVSGPGPNASVTWYSTSVGPVLRGKRVVSLMLLTMDITERRRAEADLRRQMELYEALVTAQSDLLQGMVIVNPLTQEVLYLNDAIVQIFGFSREEVRAKRSFFDNVAPEEREVLQDRLKRRLAGLGGPDHYETVVLHKDGSRRHVEVSVKPLDSPDGLRLVALVRDITERKRAREQIQKLNAELELRVRHRTAELEAANKELEAFSSSVSHDLRAPLRTIDGFSQALLEDHTAQLNEEGRHLLERVRHGTQHMAELIDDLLALSRVTRSELRRERVDLSALADSILLRFRQETPQRVVETQVSPNLVAECDLALIRVALENLLNNAWKFTSRQPKARIEFGAEPKGNETVYFVRDNGAGFDMAHSSKLFIPFERLHKATEFEGTGIGLATVQRIILRHGGRVWAEGVVNKGAALYFTLNGHRGEP